jgi:hypothetical protein
MFSRKSTKSQGRPHRIHSDVADLALMLKTLVDPYRPELHYMRGPGPKWHAKHRAGTSDVPSHPAMVRIER